MRNGEVGPALGCAVTDAVVIVELQWSLLLTVHQLDIHNQSLIQMSKFYTLKYWTITAIITSF